MKFANLVLQSPILRSRHDLFPTAGRGQAALRHQPTPGEQLVWRDAMPTSHQAYRHTRLEGLFDHANLLRGRPAPTTLNRRDDLNAIGRIGHRHGCMPHTCQVGDRVRSVRGLSHSVPSGTTSCPKKTESSTLVTVSAWCVAVLGRRGRPGACLPSLNIPSPAPTRRLEVWRGARINAHSNRPGGCSMAFPPRAFEVLETFQVPNRR